MSNYRRNYEPSGLYFFTVNLEDRKNDALTRRITDLQRAWSYAKERHPFETVAAAVLPDHMHFVWKLPSGDDDFSTRIRLIKGHFSRTLGRDGEASAGRRPGERGLWQRRFWEHTIRAEADLVACVDYVHANPVKHGLVGNVEGWRYSTLVGWRPGG